VPLRARGAHRTRGEDSTAIGEKDGLRLFEGIGYGTERESVRAAVANRKASGTKLMFHVLHGDAPAFAANDAPFHYQLQSACAVQHAWPVQRDFERAGKRLPVSSFKQHTPATDIAGPPGTAPFALAQ
jgi:hypothetical protein